MVVENNVSKNEYNGKLIYCDTAGDEATKKVTTNGKTVDDTISVCFVNANTANPSEEILKLEITDGSENSPYILPMGFYENGQFIYFSKNDIGSNSLYTFRKVSPNKALTAWAVVNTAKEPFHIIYNGSLGSSSTGTLTDSIENYRAITVVGTINSKLITMFIPKDIYYYTQGSNAFILNNSDASTSRSITFGFSSAIPTSIYTGTATGGARINKVYGIY